jgi:hypothetical protein
MELIQTVTVGSGGAANISFSSISSSYDDLLLVTSLRGTNSDATAVFVQFNGSTTGYSARRLLGDGSSASSASFTTAFFAGVTGSSYTSNTFTNDSLYIPNYRSAVAKSFSSDHVTENNATASFQAIYAGQWTGTDAITSLVIAPFTGNFVQNSSASLYGIKKF